MDDVAHGERPVFAHSSRDAALLVGRIWLGSLKAFDRWDIVQVGQFRVAGTQLIEALGAVTVPLPEHEDRGLHFDGHPGHLEGGVVVVCPEVAEELFIPLHFTSRMALLTGLEHAILKIPQNIAVTIA